MFSFSIISDSSCDLPESYRKEHEIDLVSYFVTLDGVNYRRENIDITLDEFYQALKDTKIFPKTSLPPTTDYINAFLPALNRGQDVLCICLTSKFSGSYQSAHIAQDMLIEKYPDRKIVIVDSMLCTIAQGMLVQEAVKLRNQGRTIDEVKKIIDELKHNVGLAFTVDNLDHLQRGGRIGKVSSIAGSLLNIKPIIIMKNGELVPFAKVRGRKKAIDELIHLVANDINVGTSGCDIRILHSDCIEDLDILKTSLIKRLNMADSDLSTSRIGTTIGTHIGSTVVGIAYMKHM